MKTGFDAAPPFAVNMLLGGSPDEMDRLADSEGFCSIDFSLPPYELAHALERAGRWVRQMQIRFPDNDVDLWVEVDSKETT